MVVGREDVVRARVRVDDGEEFCVSLRTMRDCLAVVLYVLLELEVMRSRHLDAEVAVRFIVAPAVLSFIVYQISSFQCLRVMWPLD